MSGAIPPLLKYAFMARCSAKIIFGSSVSTVTRLRVERPGFNSRQEQGSFQFSPPHPDRLWGPHRFSYPVVPEALSRGVKGQGRELTTHFHLVLRLRMRGAIPPLHNMSSWHGV
jgi:hypothetical protein